MKKKQLITGAFGFAITALLFTSCASDHNGSFSARKYTHFRKGEATVYVNPTAKNKQSVETENIVSKNNFSNTPTTPKVVAKNNIKISSPKSQNNVSVAITKSSRKNIFCTPKTEAIKAIAPVSSNVQPTNEITKNRFNRSASKMDQTDQVVQIILAILIPPLGVFLHENVVNTKFWIDLILTLIFYFPGMIYALLVVTDSI